MRASQGPERLAWEPQPGPRSDLISCPAPEIFFGGARGGGKTDGMLGKWAKKEADYGPAPWCAIANGMGPRNRTRAWSSRPRRSDEHPMLFVFQTCRALIRTVPLLRHDPDRPEDLDTQMEDHAADETRYACLSRPYVAAKREEARPRNVLAGYSSIERPGRVSILTL
jgi:hypothetical protein